jgi:hypothetical protein
MWLLLAKTSLDYSYLRRPYPELLITLYVGVRYVSDERSLDDRMFAAVRAAENRGRSNHKGFASYGRSLAYVYQRTFRSQIDVEQNPRWLV